MTAIIVIAGIVALIWGGVVLRHGGLLAGCLGVLLIGTCLGPMFFSHKVGPLPVSADRVLLAVVTAVYGFVWLRGGIESRRLGLPDYLLGALLLFLTISTLTHDWRIESAQPLSNLVFYYLAPAAMYWLARSANLDQRSLTMAFGALAILGLYLGITAIAEAKQMWWMVYPKYIASSKFEEFFGRGRGPLLNPIGNGVFLTVSLACVCVLWPARASSYVSAAADHLRRGGVLLAAFVVLAGAYFTLTRSVWLGVLLVIVLIIGPTIPRRLRPSAAIACLLVGCSLLAFKWDKLQSFKRDQNVSAFEMSQSAGLRPVLANVAWKMFLDRPITGCGLGQYKQIDIDYLRDSTSSLPLEKARPYNQHNVFLALLTETGLVGVGLFLASGCFWLRDAWRLRKLGDATAHKLATVFFAGMIAYVVNGMLHDLTVIPMVHMLLFTLAGMCRGLATTSVEQTRPTKLPAFRQQLSTAT